MDRAESGDKGRGRLWRWLARRSPFAWLVVAPVLTGPLSAVLLFALGEDLDAGSLGLPAEHRPDIGFAVTFYYFDFWPTWLLLTGPGLLNLLVALWFLSRSGYVRVAAGAALVMALVRTFVVLLVFFAISQTNVIAHEGGMLIRVAVEAKGIFSDTGQYAPWFAKFRLLATLWLYGAYVWAVTLALWPLFNLLMDRFWPNLEPPLKRQPGEPRAWGDFLGRR